MFGVSGKTSPVVCAGVSPSFSSWPNWAEQWVSVCRCLFGSWSNAVSISFCFLFPLCIISLFTHSLLLPACLYTLLSFSFLLPPCQVNELPEKLLTILQVAVALSSSREVMVKVLPILLSVLESVNTSESLLAVSVSVMNWFLPIVLVLARLVKWADCNYFRCGSQWRDKDHYRRLSFADIRLFVYLFKLCFRFVCLFFLCLCVCVCVCCQCASWNGVVFSCD